MLEFASLGSGSKGNATLIRANETTILVDCGFALAETERRLNRLQCDPSSISVILLTHEHGDHASGVGKLSRKYDIPVCLTVGTHHACKDNQFSEARFINTHDSFAVGGVRIQSFPVPHDAREPCQFIFSRRHIKLGVLTDTGCITPCIVEHLDGVHGLLLECNYDFDLLSAGPYPLSLKNRVSGNFGHLDNLQSRYVLEQINTANLQCLIGMHMSEKNNHNERVLEILKSVDNAQVIDIEVACQQNGFFWKKIL